MKLTDEQIAAYADGEIGGAQLAEIEAAIAADPELARKVEAHRALKAKLSAHFAPIADAPVPEHLAAMLSPKDNGEVVSFAAERQKRGLAPAVRRWLPIAGPALAASLVLVIMQPWQGGAAPEGYADTRLAAVLDSQLASEQASDADTRILVSFESTGGELCRAYSDGGNGGIACRDATGWQIERNVALEAGAVTEFRQAGSEADLLAAAQDMAAGAAMDAAAEAEARERGWR